MVAGAANSGLYLRNGAASKYSFKDGEAASDDDVVADVLHDAGGLAGHEREQDGSCRRSDGSRGDEESHQRSPGTWEAENPFHLYTGSRRGRARRGWRWWSRRVRTGSRWDPRTPGRSTAPPSNTATTTSELSVRMGELPLLGEGELWPCSGCRSPSSVWPRSSTPAGGAQTGRRGAAASARREAACRGRRRTCRWRSAWWSECWRRSPRSLQEDMKETCERAAARSPASTLRQAPPTGRGVPDLPHRRVQLDVQTLRQRHGNARVAVPHRQVAACELEVVVLQRGNTWRPHSPKRVENRRSS